LGRSTGLEETGLAILLEMWQKWGIRNPIYLKPFSPTDTKQRELVGVFFFF
jgi:hypothetical protein